MCGRESVAQRRYFNSPSNLSERLALVRVMLPKWLSGKESACQCRTQETRVQSLGCEDPLEKEVATHSSILAWKVPWVEEPGGLQSMGPQRVEHD